MSQHRARALITGCSSFTGAAFASELHASGIDVIAATTRPVEQYSGVQALRLRGLPADLEQVPLGLFGSPTFLAGMESIGRFDVLLFHHAHIGDHRSNDFDVNGSADASTRALDEVLEISRSKGAQAVVITRSVFEAGEGGDGAAPPYSRYGLAKSCISRRVKEKALQHGLATKDFVIPNPVGPLEKPGLSSHLARTWLRGEIPTLASPDAMRDFIPVELLARAFVQSVLEAVAGNTDSTSPSMWPMRVGEWAQLLAQEFGRRLDRNLEVRTELGAGNSYTLDRRIGREPVVVPKHWSGARFWDEYLRYFVRESQVRVQS